MRVGIDGTSSRPHFVYRCYDRSGDLLYVGCTSNLDQRFASHRTQSWTWYGQLDRVRLIGPFVGFAARRRAMAVERQIIESERPQHNTTYRESGIKAWESRKRLRDGQHELHGVCAYRRCAICKPRKQRQVVAG